MKEPAHSPTCRACGASSRRGRNGKVSPDSIRSLHSAIDETSTGGSRRREETIAACDQTCRLPEEAYCVRRKLCSTTYGSVRLCTVLRRAENDPCDSRAGPSWVTTDDLVAIKTVNLRRLHLSGRHLDDPVNECAAHQLLGRRNRHIVTLSHALQTETHLYLVFPYLSGGELLSALFDEMALSPTGLPDESLARARFVQILSAVAHLQKKGVCHRGLSLKNLHLDDKGNVVLVDLGLCLRVPYADPVNLHYSTDVSNNTQRRLVKAQGQCGDITYTAPEALRRNDFDAFAIDLWSAGVVLFEILVGRRPFDSPSASDANFTAICVEGRLAEIMSSKGIDLSRSAIDLLQRMLASDPAGRMTLAEVADHPWTRGETYAEVPSLGTGDGPGHGWFVTTLSTHDDDDDSSDLPLFLTVMTKSDETVLTTASTTAELDSPAEGSRDNEDCPHMDITTAVDPNSPGSRVSNDNPRLSGGRRCFFSFTGLPMRMWRKSRVLARRFGDVESELFSS